MDFNSGGNGVRKRPLQGTAGKWPRNFRQQADLWGIPGRGSPMTAKLKLWILTLAVILAFGILIVLILSRSEQALLNQARRNLAASAQEKAQLLGAWRANLSTTLIALAEQREIREAAAKISSDQAASSWRDGFIAACDASFRAIQISHPALENLSVRALDGVKIAGSGAAKEEVFYPDLRLRISQQPISPSKEKWIVPVRDPQAIPLAYIVSDINVQQSKRALWAGEPPAEYLICLDDSSGHRIWDSNDTLRIPMLEPSADQFDLEGARNYILMHTPIPGATWRLSLAQERSSILAAFHGSREYLILGTAGALILIPLLGLALSRRR